MSEISYDKPTPYKTRIRTWGGSNLMSKGQVNFGRERFEGEIKNGKPWNGKSEISCCFGAIKVKKYSNGKEKF